MEVGSASARRGVSPAALVFFIIVAVAALVLCYFVYSAKEDWRKNYEEQTEKLNLANSDKEKCDQLVKDWEKTAGVTLEYLKAELTEEQDTVKKLIDAERQKASAALALADTRQQAWQKASDELARKTVEVMQRDTQIQVAVDKVNQSYKNYRDDKEKDLGELRKELESKQAAARRAEQEMRAAQAQMTAAAQEYNKDKLNWVAERVLLMARIKDLLPVPGLASVGQIVTVDAYTDSASINLGKRQRVKHGMLFEVYSITPGGEQNIKGRAEVLTVGDLASAVALRDVEPANPVLPGDYLRNPFLRPHPKFVVAGWFPPELDYREAEIKQLVRQWGGEVQDEVTVDTDYLVLGQYALLPRVVDEKAKQAAQRGLDQFNAAKTFGHVILNVERFLNLARPG